MTAQVSAIRGPVLTYTDEPFTETQNTPLGYEPDALILLHNGQIAEVGPADQLKDKIPSGSDIQQSNYCRFIKILTRS